MYTAEPKTTEYNRSRRLAWQRLLSAVVAAGLAFLGPLGCTTPAPPPSMDPLALYRVGAPDQIQVSILPEPVIERILTVRPDGKISLDLIGDVQVAGRTTEQIAEAIRIAIGRYKRDASVTVTLIAAESDTISLFGEVRSPGTFPILHDIRVAEAIAQLGGTTLFASKRSVRIIRTDGKKTVIHSVNLSKIQSGDLSSNIQLLSGDIVVVPPTVMARIGYFLQQILFPFQPILQVGGSYGAVRSVAGL